MPLPSDTYRQLTAMANASDRSNRPTTLLVIPGVAVVVAIVVNDTGHVEHRIAERDQLIIGSSPERTKALQIVHGL